MSGTSDGQQAARFPGTSRGGTGMNDLIRSALIVTLGLGLSLLCSPQIHSRTVEQEALVEPIWSLP